MKNKQSKEEEPRKKGKKNWWRGWNSKERIRKVDKKKQEQRMKSTFGKRNTS